MKITKYYNKEKDRYYLLFEEALYVTLILGKGCFRGINNMEELIKNYIPFDQKGLQNFFFQDFLENFFYYYYKDETNTFIAYRELHIEMVCFS